MSTPHTVRPGENLSSIARQYKLKSWKEIYWHEDNKGFRKKRHNENLIFPGDVVMIPGGPAGPKAALVPVQPALSCDSKAAAVAILKTSASLDANTKAMLSPGLVTGIIAAETKRLDWWEKKGVDGDTKGPGQIGNPLYADVVANLRPELNQFLVHMGMNCRASPPRGCGFIPIAPKGYPQDVIEPVVSDFFIAAGLAVKVKRAVKAGRSADDQLQFGIGLYHGAHDKIAAAQEALSPVDKGASVLAYQPVKNSMLSSSDAEIKDVPVYVEEIFKCR